MYLISPQKKQYKANLHCHSVISDGKKTPQELKDMYKSHGYAVLSITDHETPHDHSCLNDEDFITITGYEAYIRPNAENRSDVYEEEIHMNLFARDPHNTAMVWYLPKYCRYISKEQQDTYRKVGPQAHRPFTVEGINEFVKVARENGYIVSYNHPYWSMQDEATILQYEGFFSMEMHNYSSFLLNGLEYNAPLYDKWVASGARIFCHSADDNHNKYPDDSPQCDSFGGFTMIMPEAFTYDALFEAMEQGEMYSSMGPTFREISVRDGVLHVECSDVKWITAFTGSKRPNRVCAETGKTVTSADIPLDPRAKFVRVSVMDADGNFADTRAFSRAEVGLDGVES